MKPDKSFYKLLSPGAHPKRQAETLAMEMGWNPISKPASTKGFFDRQEGKKFYFYFSKNLKVLEVVIIDENQPQPKAERKQETLF